MTNIIKLIAAPLISLIILMSLMSTGHAETTVSAEVGFIFNMWFPCHVHGGGFCNVRIWHGNFKKCIGNLC